MALFTPLNKVRLEGHFSAPAQRDHAVSRPTVRCCTIAGMRGNKNRGLQQIWRGFAHLFKALPCVALPAAAAASAGGRADTPQLLAAVCIGALIVLVAVAVVQRRRGPSAAATPTQTTSSELPARIADMQATLDSSERALAERTRELNNAARELDSLAHSVSHDLRAPLRVVDGFATIVLEDYGDRGKPLDDLGRDHLRRIVAASQRMNTMIDTLLGMSRMTSRELAREKVDLSQSALELAEDLRDDARAREPARSIEFVIAPGIKADGDPTLLRLVLQNLLGNAVKFSAKRRDARVEFGCTHDASTTVYFVRDNGAGFDMRFAEKMFGMFQRLHSANEFAGTGVGLATVQKIVRRHAGRVWAEAVPAPAEGHGATFYFTLWEKDGR